MQKLSNNSHNHTPPLRLIFWELTGRCNLSCVHCRASAGEGSSPAEMSTSECMAVIDDISGSFKPILILTGGEPLLRDDIFEIAFYSCRSGMRTCLATNGTLITGDVAFKIAETGIERVSISLDGCTEETHDAFRGIPGSFKEALKGFDELSKVGVELQINMTVARHNQREVEGGMDMARRLGARAFHIFMLVPVGCGVHIGDDQMIVGEDYEEILSWFYERSTELKDIELKATCAPHYARIKRQKLGNQRSSEFGVRSSELEGRMEKMRRCEDEKGEGKEKTNIECRMSNVECRREREERISNLEGRNGETGSRGVGESGKSEIEGSEIENRKSKIGRRGGCLGGKGVCFIGRDGDVQPCGYLPVIAGNVKISPLSEIWVKSEVFNNLRDPGKLKGKCGVCRYRVLCSGCRARAYSKTQDYLAEDPYCVYRPEVQGSKLKIL